MESLRVLHNMDMDEWTDDLPWIGQYVLDENGNAVRAKSLLSWGKWMQEHRADCHLAQDQIGEACVSTIFLGLDSFMVLERHLPHVPVLWETMVFGGPYDQFQNRYSSKDDALRGHSKIVQMLTS